MDARRIESIRTRARTEFKGLSARRRDCRKPKRPRQSWLRFYRSGVKVQGDGTAAPTESTLFPGGRIGGVIGSSEEVLPMRLNRLLFR